MFRKPYVVRRYAPETDEGTPYEDMTFRLNIQPLSADQLQALPEGQRSIKRLRVIGSNSVRTVEQALGTFADRLFYKGAWYECESADDWDHTPLAHYESQWVAVPENAPMEPPPELEVPV